MREAVGLRQFHCLDGQTKERSSAKKKATASVKQYRGEDGKFYFKLTDAAGRVLLISVPFDSGKEAGVFVGQLKKGQTQDILAKTKIAEGVTEDDVRQALTELA